MQQAAAAGVADFRAMFEAQKLAELGKQQVLEAFARQKAEQALQKEADKLAGPRQEREAKQDLKGRGWSR